MAKRDTKPARREPVNQIDPAVDLRRDGNDADVWRAALDLAEDLRAIERLFPCRSRRSCLSGPTPASARRGFRRHASGCAPLYSGLMKLLSRCAGNTRAESGSGVSRARRTCSRTAANIRRRAGDGRRTEAGHAKTRASGSRYRRPRSAVQRVEAFHAVDVHIDETRHDVMSVKRKVRRASRP